MNDIVIVDYGMGNLRSVANAFRLAAPQASVCVSGDPAVVEAASRIVFPGQGAMPDCMRQLKETGLVDVLLRAAREKPFMGICIGLQMLFCETEEGHVDGLRVLSGQVRRFPETMTDVSGMRLKIPQMGWNRVRQVKSSPLWKDVPDNAWFYFVHSYYVALDIDHADYMIGETDYGMSYASAVASDNLFGVQFHPEKSGKTGIQVLRNFVAWAP